MELYENRRVLLIDDNESIHVDFRKIIGGSSESAVALDSVTAALFDEPVQAVSEQAGFEIDSAYQGQDGLALVEKGIGQGHRYALAFVDIRMPPGWDGIETIQRMWRIDPEIQVVICTAYSDYSWSDMIRVLGETDRLLILKKPFDNIEVRQITSALIAKWNLTQKANRSMQELHEMVQERTTELDQSNQLLRQEVAERKRSEEALREAETRTRVILDTAPDGIITIDGSGTIESLNAAAEGMFGYTAHELIGDHVRKLMPSFTEHTDNGTVMIALGEKPPGYTHQPTGAIRRNGEAFPVEVGISELRFNERTLQTAIVRDMTSQRLLEAQLIQAQKLESIGHLAAGIAHEINTPTQYVGHNTQFLKDAFHELSDLLDHVDALLIEAENSGGLGRSVIDQLAEAVKGADITYLRDEIPKAIDQSLEGVRRVTAIVGAVREFSHPGGDTRALVDLNRAIESTAVVARNEWAQVAELKYDLDPELPPVPCVAAELNQVFLNLIVNAAHAIEHVQTPGDAAKGTITLRTRRDGNWAVIEIADIGCGSIAENHSKIFDPFFTTKDVGKGTGQGLSISRTIVVKKHHGELSFESTLGKGTTFTIRLPLAADQGLTTP